jgi:Glycosyl hydrolase family 1
MTFDRGVTLPVAVTLGYDDACDLGPTTGNDFVRQWPDDLKLLAESGVESVRITFDWARLQPRHDAFSGDWVEHYENVIDAATTSGIAVWATMHDGGVPRWFDDEGGLDDDEALIRRWPRFVERVAERFGDGVSGWLPYAVLPADLPARVWTDTWSILRGGKPPVSTSFSFAAGVGDVSRRLDELDIVGFTLESTIDPDTEPSDADVRIAGDRWADAIYEAADAAHSKPILVSEFVLDHLDVDVCAVLVERLVGVLDAATADGLDLSTCFVGPAIAGPGSPAALFDIDRAPQPAVASYVRAPTSLPPT